MNSRLGREFFLRSATTVAPDLLGKVLVKQTAFGFLKWRIVETEAYCGIKDKAAHSYGGRRTPRTEIMYHQGGHLYIYFIYGMYYMLNIVANIEGVPEAILIRALQPLSKDSAVNTSGPGKLCRALGIDKSLYGLDLCTSKELFLLDDGYRPEKIVATKRVNIDYAEEYKEKPWRFYIFENPYVSRK
ncbi:MAG: DNA-3-methyladenine glycosylase [Bacilli bacterium]|jgi:DNA-3-methyladenine glycosylase